MALVIAVSNGIYSPTNPTTHKFMHACFGPPDIARTAINEDEICHGIKCVRESNGCSTSSSPLRRP
jgi:hypothetical protein